MNWAIFKLDYVVESQEIIPLTKSFDLIVDQYKEGLVHKKIGEIYYE